MLPRADEGRQPDRPRRSPVSRGAARSVSPEEAEECHGWRSRGKQRAHDQHCDSHPGADRRRCRASPDHRRGQPPLPSRSRGRDPDPPGNPPRALRPGAGPPRQRGHRTVGFRAHLPDVPGRHGARSVDHPRGSLGTRRLRLGSLPRALAFRRGGAACNRFVPRLHSGGSLPDHDRARDPVAHPARRRGVADGDGTRAPVGGRAR